MICELFLLNKSSSRFYIGERSNKKSWNRVASLISWDIYRKRCRKFFFSLYYLLKIAKSLGYYARWDKTFNSFSFCFACSFLCLYCWTVYKFFSCNLSTICELWWQSCWNLFYYRNVDLRSCCDLHYCLVKLIVKFLSSCWEFFGSLFSKIQFILLNSASSARLNLFS